MAKADWSPPDWLLWRGAMAEEQVFETLRLTLAPHGIADFPALAALWGDPEVVAFIGGQAATEEEAWARLLRYRGTWALFGHGFWAVRERASGDYVGDVGYLEARRTGVTGFDGDPEIGWSLNVRHHGKGYATEAVQAVLGWGARRFGRCVAMIDPGNEPSLAVARRCGFHHFADSRYKDAPTTLWEHRFG